MNRNRKQNIRLLALILILLLGIGFAALAANLKIDGTLNVSRTSWDVHFENVSITEGSVEANPAPTSDDTTTTEMAYTINFTKPGDYFEFTTDIVNEGTIDAMVDVVSNNAYADSTSTTPITLPTYLTSTVTYIDGVPIAQNHQLLHGTSEKIKVRVEFRTDINPSDLPTTGAETTVFKFKADYKQKDDNAIDGHPNKYYYVVMDENGNYGEEHFGVNTLGDNLYYGVWGHENISTGFKEVCANVLGRTICLEANHYDCGEVVNNECSNSNGYTASKMRELQSLESDLQEGASISCGYDNDSAGCHYISGGDQLYFDMYDDGEVSIGESAYACSYYMNKMICC